MERREAPHPYVIGVHAPSPRRVADSPSPQGARRGARHLPALHIPRPRGRRKKGKGAPWRPKI